MQISIIIISYNRKKELRECLNNVFQLNPAPMEILILDNCSEDGTREMMRTDELFAHNIVRIIEAPANLGVAGGRNYALKQAKGDLLFFLDDDAIIEPGNALQIVNRYFSSQPALGVLAFKIVNYHSKTIQREEFPHKNKRLYNRKEFNTSYYVGAGHVIPRNIFNECGLYPEDYFYGMEELDLSMRVMDHDYNILYTDEITVYHKKALSGRVTNKEKYKFMLRNRLIISYKYLRWSHFISTFIIWSLKTAMDAKDLQVILNAVKEFLRYRKNVTRCCLKNNTFKRISKLRGRLWY